MKGNYEGEQRNVRFEFAGMLDERRLREGGFEFGSLSLLYPFSSSSFVPNGVLLDGFAQSNEGGAFLVEFYVGARQPCAESTQRVANLLLRRETSN